MLTIVQGTILVRMARHAIASYLSEKPATTDFDHRAALPESSGIFVNLFEVSKGRSMRGCVGDPFGSGELSEVVQKVAVEAATTDYRFKPVKQDEFNKNIVVEVNVLSPLEPIWVRNPQDYVLNIAIGRDGLMVDGSGFKGLLLPQVAVEEGFDAEEFLCHSCMKAGLPPDSWLAGSVHVSKFQCQIFAEETPNGPIMERRVDTK